MATSKRFLALNIGASRLTLAEFEAAAGQNPTLLRYGMAPLEIDPERETDPAAYIIDAMRKVMAEKGMRPAPLMMSLSGQSVFPRFIKLPPVSKDKLYSMVRYEAEQNVPFPIAEVVWDYQLIGDTSAGDQNAMIVAVKTDAVTSLSQCVAAAGLEPEIVDVAPLAEYNCIRHNYPDAEGCTMLLDIGARSTSLLFVEEGKVFYRNIPVAGNAITQEIAKSLGVDFATAERLKIEKGSVSLGGNHAEADEEADTISKIIRNVITRLHAEINRSVNFYRSQQDGTPPTRILLTGGSSVIRNLDTFFNEKIGIEVQFLDPFANITVGGTVDAEQASNDFYGLGEVVGLAVRQSRKCEVEINLMPPDLVAKRAFLRKVPYFVIAAVLLVASSLLWLMKGSSASAASNAKLESLKADVSQFAGVKNAVTAEIARRDALVKEIDQYRDLIESRAVALRRVTDLRDSLLDGMWLTSVKTVQGQGGECIAITVRGFEDTIDAARKAAGSAKTPDELLCERLGGKASFTNDVGAIRIVKSGDASDASRKSKIKVKEYQIEIPLNPGLKIEKEGR